MRGPTGSGHSGRLNTTKILRLSADLPLVIEIVDTGAAIRDFLPAIDPMTGSGLIALGKAPAPSYGSHLKHVTA